ncbi:hypothetical protein QQZ08_000617 [Neonectria magnoliae]|uniref:Major facilitator superfamily (MFS) profile domain-containing protein n=1 Tax=Neonectria magnoliae TaxID=2732573 RepID=A0ABR1IIB8_9HYPO
MAAGMIPLAGTFRETLHKLSYVNGATPLALEFGRRPVYILSNVLMGIACVWLGIASNATYTSFIIGRVFLGLFEAPIKSIVPTTVTDIFFLQDRDEKVSFYGMSILGGNELGPLFSALIIQRFKMAWAFYIVARFICLGCTSIFFMSETKYTGTRPQPFPIPTEIGTDEKAGVERIENLGSISNTAPFFNLRHHGPGPPKPGQVETLREFRR